MEKLLATTSIDENFMLTIPEAVLNEFPELKSDNVIIDWSVNCNGEIVIKPREKVTLDDVVGSVKDDDSRNAVELKRDLYNI